MRVWIRRGLALLLLISTLVLLLFTDIGNGIGSSATAEVSMTREAQGQMLYQSRQHLPDQQGNDWLVIASKHVGFTSPPSIDLILAGCPGFVDIDHSQPLTLTTSQGKIVKVKSLPESFYTELLPGPNVAQYNLQPIVPKLDAALDLLIPIKGMKSIQVEVPTQVVQEWQTVATCADILCEPLTFPAINH